MAPPLLADFPVSQHTCDWSILLGEERRAKAPLAGHFVPMTNRVSVMAAISEVANECSVEGWSGYRSEPIGKAAQEAAERFVCALPADLPDPDVSALAEGLIAFEWYFGQDRLLVAVPNLQYGVDYMVHEGTNIEPGSAPFFGEIPTQLLATVRRLQK